MQFIFKFILLEIVSYRLLISVIMFLIFIFVIIFNALFLLLLNTGDTEKTFFVIQKKLNHFLRPPVVY